MDAGSSEEETTTISKLGKYVSNFVRTALYTILPNKVDEYSYENYVKEYYLFEKIHTLYSTFIFYQIANHYDMIYVPLPPSLDTSSRERKAYSLFRFQGDVQVGLKFFKHYADVIHVLANIWLEEIGKLDRLWLERVTGLCRRYNDWNSAHIAASLNFVQAFKNKRVCSLVNVADEETGATPLFVAVRAENLVVVRVLVALTNIDLTILDTDHNSVLHIAARHSSPDIIQAVLASTTSLKSEIRAGDWKNRRLNLNCINSKGETPLYLACLSKSSGIVEILLKAGVNPLVGSTDRYPLHVSVDQDCIDCVDLLCKYCPAGLNVQTREKKMSALHLAKNKPMFDKLCDLGVELNLRDAKGRTVLHTAVQEQNLDSIIALLVRGAEAGIHDNKGVCPLHLAVEKTLDIHIVYALIVFEADVNADDNNGATARHWLCRHESGIYQRSSARDTILYALDAVQAHRCLPGMSNCTEGCISVMSVIDGSTSSPSSPPRLTRSTSFSYIYQVLQDMSLSSPTISDPTGNLFNGTPPAPVLDKSKLIHDLDNDLFSYSADKTTSPRSPPESVRNGKTTPPPGLPTLKDKNPRLSSTTQRIKNKLQSYSPTFGLNSSGRNSRLLPGSDIDSDSIREVSEDDSAAPWYSNLNQSFDDVHVNDVFEEDEEQNEVVVQDNISVASPTTQETKQHNFSTWTLGQSIISRFLAVTMPGVEDIFDEAVEASEKASVVTAENKFRLSNSASLPEFSNMAMVNNTDMKTSRSEVQKWLPVENRSAYPGNDYSSNEHTSAKESDNAFEHEQLPVPNNDDLFNPDNREFRFTWSRQFPNCSAAPGIPCCQARNARRISARSSSGSSLCPSTSSQSDISFTTDPEGFRVGPKGYRILSLDGGGIRGLVLCQALRALERAADKPIRDLYDWIIGTSTGAMLALNLAQGKCVRYNRCLYFRMKDQLFVGSRPYSTEVLENYLITEFGSKTTMKSLTQIRVAVASLRGDHFPPKLYMFRNYRAPYESMDDLVNNLVAARKVSSVSKPHDVEDQKDSNAVATHYGSRKERHHSMGRGVAAAIAKNKRRHAAADSISNKPNNPLVTDLPYHRLLGPFIMDLFGETIVNLKTEDDNSEDLHESILALLSAFTRRYVYNSQFFTNVPWDQQLIWQAARASGAAPSYFRAFGPFLDGGMIANNPTLDILTEVHEINLIHRLRRESPIRIACVTSIGTGRVPTREVHQFEVFRPRSMTEAYQAAMGFTELSRFILEVACMSEGRVVERARAWCSSISVPFFRVSPLLSDEVSLDTKDNRIILQMLWETEAYLFNIQDRLQRLANQLIGDSD